jgi:RNA polymerase sigma factor (sigma-70 family)
MTSAEDDDIAALTAGLAAGDEAAVERFHHQWFPRLYAAARAASGRDESFCLDVVQEAMLRILRCIRPVGSAARLGAWTTLVVRTTAWDLLTAERRRRRREEEWGGALAPRGPDPDAERLAWLRAEIQALDPALGRMFRLRYEQGWTLARIAARLGLTLGSVDGHLRRALEHLRLRAQGACDD